MGISGARFRGLQKKAATAQFPDELSPHLARATSVLSWEILDAQALEVQAGQGAALVVPGEQQQDGERVPVIVGFDLDPG
ncbi:MAG: hypothetical protein A2Z40_04220 [Deltaproteobacteria bacterium RBG_19FT_COMBO_60_16]|nr:MAG: hypothetical protein A2Z40_04220 [Deltaproteobacteria bacterium RBG_19FT_COMBO_60_16]